MESLNRKKNSSSEGEGVVFHAFSSFGIPNIERKTRLGRGASVLHVLFIIRRRKPRKTRLGRGASVLHVFFIFLMFQ